MKATLESKGSSALSNPKFAKAGAAREFELRIRDTRSPSPGRQKSVVPGQVSADHRACFRARFSVVVLSGVEFRKDVDEGSNAPGCERPPGIHQWLVVGEPGAGFGKFFRRRAGPDNFGDHRIVDLTQCGGNVISCHAHQVILKLIASSSAIRRGLSRGFPKRPVEI